MSLVENPLLLKLMNDPLTETRRLATDAYQRGVIENDELIYVETVLNIHQLMPTHNRVKSDYKSMMKMYFMLDTLFFVKEELELHELYDIVRRDFRMVLVCNDTLYPTRIQLQMGITGYAYWETRVDEDMRKQGIDSLVKSMDSSYVAKCYWMFDMLMEVCVARHFRNDAYLTAIKRMLESVEWNRLSARRDAIMLGNLRYMSRYYPITYGNRPFTLMDYTSYHQWMHSIVGCIDQQAKKFSRSLLGERRTAVQ